VGLELLLIGSRTNQAQEAVRLLRFSLLAACQAE
jgi:hypothetical protein